MSNIFDIFAKIEKTRAPAPTGPVTHIIVGLGNPGKEYEHTRHNTGFMCLDALAADIGVKVDRYRFQGMTGDCRIGDTHCLLLKPYTLMNASGISVSEAAAYYHVPPERILVICDDINLPVGGMRLRLKGSDGGQKGLRSITNMLSSENFPRLRIGVGAKPHPDYDLAKWVLSDFSMKDREVLGGLFRQARVGIELFLEGKNEAAVQKCSAKPTPPPAPPAPAPAPDTAAPRADASAPDAPSAGVRPAGDGDTPRADGGSATSDGGTP